MDAIHATLDRAWDAMDRVLAAPPGTLWRMHFATAVAEIAANIIMHAHRDTPACATANMQIELLPDRLVVTFRDRGAAFIEPHAAEPELDPDPLAEHGRGLPLARAALDELTTTRSPGGENIWVLVKRFEP